MKTIKGDFTQQYLICPYCPNRPKASHRTALYKVKHTGKGMILFKCMGCNKTFKVMPDGLVILKRDYIIAIEGENK